MGLDRIEQSIIGKAQIAGAYLGEGRALLTEDLTDGQPSPLMLQCAVIGCPGQCGQTSPAVWPQTVITRFMTGGTGLHGDVPGLRRQALGRDAFGFEHLERSASARAHHRCQWRRLGSALPRDG